MSTPMYRLKRNHAGVCVKKVGSNYKVNHEEDLPVVSVRSNTLVMEMRKDRPLILDGVSIAPSGGFFITAETIDPYHIILDISNQEILSFVRYV